MKMYSEFEHGGIFQPAMLVYWRVGDSKHCISMVEVGGLPIDIPNRTL